MEQVSNGSGFPLILTCLIFYVVTTFDTSLILIRLASCMLASGCDDGTFSIRDLRLLKVSLV